MFSHFNCYTANEAPKFFRRIPEQLVINKLVTAAYTFTYITIDSIGDTVVRSLDTNLTTAPGVLFEGLTGTLSWDISSTPVGTYTIVVKAVDQLGAERVASSDVEVVESSVEDSDDDGVPDDEDNCPTVPNLGQSNIDG